MPDPKLAPAASRKLTLLGLLAATYFMVAGGPYALEEVVSNAGYFGAVVLLLLVPLIWSLPTVLMISELGSTLPEEGGYYVWVRRGLGPFWGFQEAWLSLAASVFDMAIYPLLFTTYISSVYKVLGRAELQPTETTLLGYSMMAACVMLNLRPARDVGRSSILLTVALLGPFAVFSIWVVFHPNAAPVAIRPTEADWVTALLFALWNYMGWDNASTVAGEVERPQRTYPLAMIGAVLLVTLTYVIPIGAASLTGLAAGEWKTGVWVKAGGTVGGLGLAVAIGVGGALAEFGMFNSLVLSYSRVPVALAEDGFLPRVFQRRLRSGAPWVAILVCAVCWGLAAQLGLKRVLALDVILYGLALMLEFAALVALRIREPNLDRPFRVPGGTVGTVLLGILPMLLIGLAVFDQAGKHKTEEGDPFSPATALLLGAGLAAVGPLLYLVATRRMRRAG